MLKVGVISDTHGLVREEVHEVFQSVEHIIHAGDVGDSSVLDELRNIAPVTVVRGNIDKGDFENGLPETEIFSFGDRYLYIIHDLGTIKFDPHAGDCSGIIYGHTHKPVNEMQDGVLYLNPGSAGPRRFDLPVTVAILEIEHDALKAEIVHLMVEQQIES